MDPQPSTSTAAASKHASCDGGQTTNSVGVDEAVPSTSGGSLPVQLHQKERQLHLTLR